MGRRGWRVTHDQIIPCSNPRALVSSRVVGRSNFTFSGSGPLIYDVCRVCDVGHRYNQIEMGTWQVRMRMPISSAEVLLGERRIDLLPHQQGRIWRR